MKIAKNCLMTLGLLALAACAAQDDGTGSTGGGPSTDPDPTDEFPSSGIPDQDSMTVLAETFNPRARGVGNTIVPVTALLADQLGNNSTIPDGTQVYFATHGGAIETSGEFCTTENGECTVNWRSQNPIPDAGPPIADPLGSGQQVVSHSSGRANLLVWTEGVESFIDNNSNGLFDDGDTQIDDIGDPFLDRNESGTRETNEEFVDFPLPQLGAGGTYDGPDGLYSGPNCAHSTDCATGINAQSLFIFQNITIAMSSNAVCIVDVDLRTGYWETTDYGAMAPVDLKNTRDTFYFLLHDCFGNPPVIGTSVSFDSGVGELFADEGDVPNTNVDMGTAADGGTRLRYPLGSIVYSASVAEALDNDEAEQGFFEITVENDGGSVAKRFYVLDPAN